MQKENDLMASVLYMILCGGKGQRLWPLSRKNLPKQFVPCNNQKTLLEATIDRLTPLRKEHDQIGIVTSKEYFQAIQQLIGDIVDSYVIEPVGKNTAPAMLLACTQIAKEYHDDPVVVFVPSDHYIKEQDLFEQAITSMTSYAENYGDICLLGVTPRGISTSYGYIFTHDATTLNAPSNIDKFIEKPSKQVAEILVASSHALWNCGIFVARNSVFLRSFKQAAPTLLEEMTAISENKQTYASLLPCQFDTTITEKISNRVVFPTTMTWQDLGDLESFLTHNQSPTENNISVHGTNNSAFSSKKMVAFLGVSNICLIETDDIILVKQQGESDQVKDLLAQLNLQGKEHLL